MLTLIIINSNICSSNISYRSDNNWSEERLEKIIEEQ